MIVLISHTHKESNRMPQFHIMAADLITLLQGSTTFTSLCHRFTPKTVEDPKPVVEGEYTVDQTNVI